MATYAGIANELGRSKSYVLRACKRLDPTGAHVSQGADGRHEVDAYLAALVAHEAGAARGSAATSRATREAQGVASAMEVADAVERARTAGRADAQAVIDAMQARIDEQAATVADLRSQLAAERAAHEATRRELAVARACEGLHLPGHRARVAARLLPPGEAAL